MSADQLATRILAEQSGISSENLRMGKISREEFRHDFGIGVIDYLELVDVLRLARPIEVRDARDICPCAQQRRVFRAAALRSR